MYYQFFYARRVDTDSLSIEIKELSIIAPYYFKGIIESVADLYFAVGTQGEVGEYLYSRGYDLFIRHKNILEEALAYYMSEHIYNEENRKKRILIHYCLGFFKLEVKKIQNKAKNAS